MAKVLEASADDKIAAAAFDAPTEGRSAGDLAVIGGRGGMTVERIVTAQAVAVPRDDAKILQKIRALATAAGEDWYYRFPVKDHGATKWIEGPSIKCANNIARLYGNCEIDTRALDNGDSWIIYARLIDWETGFSMTRPFEQMKGQQTIKTNDAGRARQNAFQIGVSKSIRNIITNALEQFTTFAFEEARKNIVEKVGKNLDDYRARVLEALKGLKVDAKRVEAGIGRPAKDWLAPDVARVIAEIQAVKDGMATAEETWPPEGPPRPTREEFRPEAKPAAEPQQARQEGKSAAEFFTVNLDGVGETHALSAPAIAALKETFTEAARRGGIFVDAMRENNADVLQQLREAGELAAVQRLELILAPAPKEEAKPAAEAAKPKPPEEPPSPLKNKKAEWPPRVEHLKARLKGMGPQERADFLEKDADMAFIAANRAADWDAIKQLNDELLDGERG